MVFILLSCKDSFSDNSHSFKVNSILFAVLINCLDQGNGFSKCDLIHVSVATLTAIRFPLSFCPFQIKLFFFKVARLIHFLTIITRKTFAPGKVGLHMHGLVFLRTPIIRSLYVSFTFFCFWLNSRSFYNLVTFTFLALGWWSQACLPFLFNK